MAQKSAYATQMDNKHIKLINAMLIELPTFVKDFINARSINTARRNVNGCNCRHIIRYEAVTYS